MNEDKFSAVLKLVKSDPNVKLLNYAADGPVGPWIATEDGLPGELVSKVKELVPEFWERTVPITY